MSDRSIKVEPPIRREFLDVKAIRLYPRVANTTYYVNSTLERNEQPRFLVKAVYSPKRQDYEIEIVFLGTYHSEQEIPGYPTKPPRKWSSWGEFVLSAEQAGQFIEILQGMQNVIALQNGSKRSKIVQSTFGHATTIFDLSWFMMQPYANIFDYPTQVASLLSALGETKIITLLNRAKANSHADLRRLQKLRAQRP